MRARVTVAALFVAALAAALPASGSSADPAPNSEAAAKKCKKAVIGGKKKCLRAGQRCSAGYQAAYLDAGFSCRKSRLRKASLKELRRGEPVLLKKDGTVSLRTALEVIDQGVADMPGIEARKGAIGELPDATFALAAIAADLDKLSPAQRAVYEQITTPIPAGAARAVTPAEQEESLRFIDDARRAMEAHGWSFPKPITLSFVDDQDGRPANVLAYTTVDDVVDNGPTCNIFILGAGRADSAEKRRETLSHETAHCAQHYFQRSVADLQRTPMWVQEGGAQWLGTTAMREASGIEVPSNLWRTWLRLPSFDLFDRTYPAVGFFSMLEQAGVDTHARYRKVLVKARSGGSEAAFKAAISGVPKIFFDRWGPGFARKPDIGAEWDLTGPGIVPSEPPKQLISNGTSEPYASQPRGAFGIELLIRSDVFIVIADKELNGLLRGSDGKVRKLQQGAYCAKQGGCKCKTKANLSLPKIGRGSAFAGWSDVKEARAVVFEGLAIADYCKKPKPPPAKGGGKGCRRSAADRGPASCPVPPAGVEVYQPQESGDPVLVATFKEAECTAGGTFTAIAEDGAYRMEIGISDFRGFGETYDFFYGDPDDDPELILEGPGGPYGNSQTDAPGYVWAGGVGFADAKGRDVGVGLVPAINSDLSQARDIAGRMLCNYPPE